LVPLEKIAADHSDQDKAPERRVRVGPDFIHQWVTHGKIDDGAHNFFVVG
jgi:hypothetical protein